MKKSPADCQQLSTSCKGISEIVNESKNSSSDHENRSIGVSLDPLNSSHVIQSTSPCSEHILNHSHKKWKESPEKWTVSIKISMLS